MKEKIMDGFHLKERPSVEQAIASAAATETLEQLYSAIETFEGHELAKANQYTPSQTCAHSGPVMVVTEKPEPEDAETGMPFSGQYGGIMRNAMKEARVDINAVHIAYAIHWTPPGDKSPNKTQIAASRPFLFREIELVKPRAILAQGKGVMEALSGYRGNILEIAGQTMSFKWKDTIIPMMMMTHPKYCLYNGTHFVDFRANVSDFFNRYGKAEEYTLPGSFVEEVLPPANLVFKSLEQMRAARAA